MENSFWQVAMVTKISFFLSDMYVDGFSFSFPCVCELMLLSCSGCPIYLVCGKSLVLSQAEIGVRVSTEMSPLKVTKLSRVKLFRVNIGEQGLREDEEMRPCTTFPFKATL